MKITTFENSFSLYLPKLDNDGTDLEKINLYVHDYLLKTFQGVTETAAQGCYNYQGEIFIDDIIIYSVATNLSAVPVFIEGLLKYYFDNTLQHAIFYVINGVSCLTER